ncbi:unnamed protein product [Parnassius apollo]|uniref:(apollo) hypothetical protein n=1 Tax=Parnassius apollo TaxID=110799 RepID=A0A8S3X5T4_PARAO|nr:unnamed protein product [Parnassius apollo]
MPFTIPAENHELVLKHRVRYQYIRNWRKCHRTGGEIYGAYRELIYTDDLVLSVVLSFIAPFTTDCMGEPRDGIPGPKETDKPTQKWTWASWH